MKLSPAFPALWCSFLLLWISQEGNSSDVCTFSPNDNATGLDACEELPNTSKAVICLVYPTNLLNCSWSFHTLDQDAELSVSVRVSENDELVDSRLQGSAKRVGFISWMLQDGEHREVAVDFNVTLRGAWMCCRASFDDDSLHIIPPPANVTASVQDGSLNVTWDAPSESFPPHCFNYQLDMGEQEKLRNFSDKLQHLEPNVVPGHTYKVRMRARILEFCFGCTQWSEWSPTVTVGEPSFRLDPLVIAVISLGVPMMLLAVLLLLRHQRLGKVLLPPIPRPPEKYKNFLEKNDPLNFFHPVSTIKSEEEITEVEDAEHDPGATN
ncbi:uncharacterized protein LOC105930254 [Fundulus heteroclitus]|uniref:uncharacterized protein LOC105930254 n=1 Tax=Fundulus heteroclitus TaxID=8078 RepID=UPI00165BE992|nr:uncharacterized protein LOC105930254 [Fundulus heteroclitus]